MTRRHPQSTAQLERRILQMAAGAQGLTWRRLHDAVATDDRVRARETLYALAFKRQLHQRTTGRQTWFFASAELAAAWQPPHDFNRPTPVKKKAPAPTATAPQPIKYTRGPSYTHDPRYQIAPGAQVPALFSALPPGRYLEE